MLIESTFNSYFRCQDSTRTQDFNQDLLQGIIQIQDQKLTKLKKFKEFKWFNKFFEPFPL